jgi:hypothetical protein
VSIVIVFKIDSDGIAIHPAKCDPPVSTGVDRRAAFVAANKRMKAQWRATVDEDRHYSFAVAL